MQSQVFYKTEAEENLTHREGDMKMEAEMIWPQAKEGW